MSKAKVVTLIIYAGLVLAAITQSGSSVGDWSARILIIIASVHVVETLVFFSLCKRAGGSLPYHLLNVFLFGVIHVGEIKAGLAQD